MSTVQQYPGWKNAVAEVLSRVEDEGHGFTITHDELDNLFGISEPVAECSNLIKKYKKYLLAVLHNSTKMRDELLVDHNIYAESLRGIGYVIMTPDDQIKIGTEKHFQKARKALLKTSQVLSYVKVNELTDEGERTRRHGLEKIAFLMSVSRGKLESTELPKIK